MKPASRKNTKPQKNKKMQTSFAPVALGGVFRNSEPVYRAAKAGNCRISKTEYIAEVPTSEASFDILNSFIINPASPLTFPWLSAIAVRYESYKFHALSFHFRTEAPTIAPGYIGLCPDYNPEDPPPVSKVQAMDYQDSVRSPVWGNIDMVVSKDNLSKRTTYFNRNPGVSLSEPGLFDVGNLFVIGGNMVATGGSPLPPSYGELYVKYDIEFSTTEIDATSLSTFEGATVTSQELGLPINTSAAGNYSLLQNTYGDLSGGATFETPNFFGGFTPGTPETVVLVPGTSSVANSTVEFNDSQDYIMELIVDSTDTTPTANGWTWTDVNVTTIGTGTAVLLNKTISTHFGATATFLIHASLPGFQVTPHFLLTAAGGILSAIIGYALRVTKTIIDGGGIVPALSLPGYAVKNFVPKRYKGLCIRASHSDCAYGSDDPGLTSSDRVSPTSCRECWGKTAYRPNNLANGT